MYEQLPSGNPKNEAPREVPLNQTEFHSPERWNLHIELYKKAVATGDPLSALKQAREALQISEDTPPPNEIVRATSYFHFGTALINAGRRTEGLVNLERAFSKLAELENREKTISLQRFETGFILVRNLLAIPNRTRAREIIGELESSIDLARDDEVLRNCRLDPRCLLLSCFVEMNNPVGIRRTCNTLIQSYSDGRARGISDLSHTSSPLLLVHPYIWEWIGTALFRIQDFQSAGICFHRLVRFLDLAQENTPDATKKKELHVRGITATSWLVECLHRTGEKSEAFQRLMSALKSLQNVDKNQDVAKQLITTQRALAIDLLTHGQLKKYALLARETINIAAGNEKSERTLWVNLLEDFPLDPSRHGVRRNKLGAQLINYAHKTYSTLPDHERATGLNRASILAFHSDRLFLAHALSSASIAHTKKQPGTEQIDRVKRLLHHAHVCLVSTRFDEFKETTQNAEQQLHKLRGHVPDQRIDLYLKLGWLWIDAAVLYPEDHLSCANHAFKALKSSARQVPAWIKGPDEIKLDARLQLAEAFDGLGRVQNTSEVWNAVLSNLRAASKLLESVEDDLDRATAELFEDQIEELSESAEERLKKLSRKK